MDATTLSALAVLISFMSLLVATAALLLQRLDGVRRGTYVKVAVEALDANNAYLQVRNLTGDPVSIMSVEMGTGRTLLSIVADSPWRTTHHPKTLSEWRGALANAFIGPESDETGRFLKTNIPQGTGQWAHLHVEISGSELPSQIPPYSAKTWTWHWPAALKPVRPEGIGRLFARSIPVLIAIELGTGKIKYRRLRLNWLGNVTPALRDVALDPRSFS